MIKVGSIVMNKEPPADILGVVMQIDGDNYSVKWPNRTRLAKYLLEELIEVTDVYDCIEEDT